MFRDKATPLRRNRAVTLIEAVLYISVALALIVGGLVFYQQASTAAKTSAMVRQLSAITAETRVLIKGMPYSTVPYDLTAYLISAGAVPSDMVTSPTSLSNPFGGSVTFGAGNWAIDGNIIEISLSNIPQGVCARLLTATSETGVSIGAGSIGNGRTTAGAGGTTLISSGYVSAAVWSSGTTVLGFRRYIMNPTQAGWMCKYGSANYRTQSQEPTSTPLSGPVDIIMFFMADH